MKTNEIRATFIEYFKKHGHSPVKSSSLLPQDDPTLLFTNAGMNQFKGVFLGLENRDYNRAVSSQKCLRAGGKHNDLENVGHTARHHTFFEMLGNFSFGDYFKKEAIHFAWDFITNELQLPKDRLYVSVFENDDEAAEIWHKQEGVPKDRIYRFGEKDNFWRMGDTGPCGPNSEIFYDLGPEVRGRPEDNVMGGEGDRYLEFWNLVFMQFNEDQSGQQTPLPNQSIDTGAGLERIAAILQGKLNNYHTDAFLPLLERASSLSGKEYVFDLNKVLEKERMKIDEQNVAMRVLADHARAAAFLISDGVLPSNDGRGYVLRRIMRRAIRYGRKLTESTSLYPAIVQQVIDGMGPIYPELTQQKNFILSHVADEEERFLSTLDQGTHILQKELQNLSQSGLKILGGDALFKLYDTFGFPVDLTRIMAHEQGFEVNENDFEKRMEQARQKAKASWKSKSTSSDAAHLIKATLEINKAHGPTQFDGYKGTEASGKVLWLSDGKMQVDSLVSGQSGLVALDHTSFYAESGGQVGDHGLILSSIGEAQVLDCTKQNDIHLHHIKITDGSFKLNQSCQLQVLDSARRSTASNHSATHLLHSALRSVLGPHVTQAGSMVSEDRLRFDFTHNKPLSQEELQRIEVLVNQEISKAIDVNTEVMSPKAATEAGALALFGEKYGDEVRVVKMGPFSMELCGGTHVSNTAMIRIFKVVSEGGVSAGVRRIEALTGDRASEFLLLNTKENLLAREAMGLPSNWSQYMEGSNEQSREWVDKTRSEIKTLQKELQVAKGQSIDIDQIISSGHDFSVKGSSAKLVTADIGVDDRKLLSDISDKIRNKIQSGVVILVGKGSDSHPIIVSVSKNLSKSLNAGKILKEVAEAMGGKGGGRPDFAQGATQDRTNIKGAFAQAEKLVDAE